MRRPHAWAHLLMGPGSNIGRPSDLSPNDQNFHRRLVSFRRIQAVVLVCCQLLCGIILSNISFVTRIGSVAALCSSAMMFVAAGWNVWRIRGRVDLNIRPVPLALVGAAGYLLAYLAGGADLASIRQAAGEAQEPVWWGVIAVAVLTIPTASRPPPLGC